MDMSPGKRRSSGKRDFERRLAGLNCKRGIIFAISVSIVLVIYYFLAGEEQELPYWYTAMLIVAFTLQLAGAILLMYILRNAQKAMAAAYRAYFLMSLIVFMPVCIADYKVSGSIIAYVLLVGDSIFIPVLLRSELHIYTLLMATATFIYCVFVSQGGIRVVIEAAVVGGLGIVAGRYSQERFRSYIRLENENKTRNILSNEDALTGLTNKSGLINTAGVMWQFCIRNHSVAGGIFIDIDFFNNYNDAFGYSQGDECLKEIADAIASCARRDTDTVARVGGEAFFVMVEGVEKENLIALALKIRNAIAGLELEQEFTGVSKYLTVSIGVAYTYPEKGSSFKSLYDSASDAMYTAKENGRNCVVCDGTVYGRMKNGVGTAIGN